MDRLLENCNQQWVPTFGVQRPRFRGQIEFKLRLARIKLDFVVFSVFACSTYIVMARPLADPPGKRMSVVDL